MRGDVHAFVASVNASLAALFAGESTMHSIIETHRADVDRLCRQFGVQSLDVFGSATGDAFDPQRSDIDFIVDFGSRAQPELFNRVFGLNEALVALFRRQVDLVMLGGMVNPYCIESVNRTRESVYARPLTEAA